MFKEVYYLFDNSYKFQSDNGSEFENKHFFEVASQLQIKHILILNIMLNFGIIDHLTLISSVPTCWPTCVPIYCPHVDQHVLILAIHLFHHLELFYRDRIRIINALEVFLCFFNEDISLIVYKLVSSPPTDNSIMVIMHEYSGLDAQCPHK